MGSDVSKVSRKIQSPNDKLGVREKSRRAKNVRKIVKT
jgi:hypothetical protein